MIITQIKERLWAWHKDVTCCNMKCIRLVLRTPWVCKLKKAMMFSELSRLTPALRPLSVDASHGCRRASKRPLVSESAPRLKTFYYPLTDLNGNHFPSFKKFEISLGIDIVGANWRPKRSVEQSPCNRHCWQLCYCPGCLTTLDTTPSSYCWPIAKLFHAFSAQGLRNSILRPNIRSGKGTLGSIIVWFVIIIYCVKFIYWIYYIISSWMIIF